MMLFIFFFLQCINLRKRASLICFIVTSGNELFVKITQNVVDELLWS